MVDSLVNGPDPTFALRGRRILSAAFEDELRYGEGVGCTPIGILGS